MSSGENRTAFKVPTNLEKEATGLLKRNFSVTGDGIHKDDLVFLLNGYPMSAVGSQGQKRSALLALKLSAVHSCFSGVSATSAEQKYNFEKV